jgi:secondary thiamine-phosphate synthase enzyme
MGTQVGKITPVERPQSRTHHLEFETRARIEFKDITGEIQKLVSASGVSNGVCHIFVTHTTAAVLINENDDPAFTRDLGDLLTQIIPRDKAYHHNDGNCDAHLKASIIGCDKIMLVENGRLVLGRWQGIYLCEFDGPRRRGLRIKIVSD